MSAMLLGKLALITGAGSGIGRATCEVFAREGAKVIACDKNVENVMETLKSLKSGTHLGLEIDVAVKESVENVLKYILEKYKAPPTVIVNAAGITRDVLMQNMSYEDLNEVIEVNLKGTFLVTKVFVDAIITTKTQNTSIINISSLAGKTGNVGQSQYAASKAGVIQLTKTACKELGKYGIRCNAVLPGLIKTPMSDKAPERIMEWMVRMVPVGRKGTAKEVAEVIAFLGSDRSSYVNGADVEVTGGLNMY